MPHRRTAPFIVCLACAGAFALFDCAESAPRVADAPPSTVVDVPPAAPPIAAAAAADAAPPEADATDAEATAADDGEEPAQFGMIEWVRDAGEAFGVGGLGLKGLGEGGGGRGEGIGLGGIGSIGHGQGTGIGQSSARPSGDAGHVTPPKMREGSTIVTGELPPEVIRRIMRANYPRFRACYELALQRNAKLSGTVGARFVIGRNGAVAMVGDSGSTLGDPSVVTCVLRAVERLTFPPFKRGVVSVLYPITFEPGS